MAVHFNGKLSYTTRLAPQYIDKQRGRMLNYASPSPIPTTSEGCKTEFHEAWHDFDEDEEFYIIGDRVYIDGLRPASVAYFGETEFGQGDWLGVVLDHPTGNHDGKLHGRSYFQCAVNHGLFVRPARATKMLESRQTNITRATTTRGSTSPSNLAASGRSSSTSGKSGTKSPGSGILDAYFYDEDYRVPTVDSLSSKLGGLRRHLTVGGSKSEHPNIQGTQGADGSNASFGAATRRLVNHSIEWGNRNKPFEFNSNNHDHSPTIQCTNELGSRGILKHNQRPNSTDSSSWISSKTEELAQRLSQVRTPVGVSPSQEQSKSSVFEFRPARCPLLNLATEASDSTEYLNEIIKGDRVSFRLDGRGMQGIVRYLGKTHFAAGDWAGIELDWPEGNCDGRLFEPTGPGPRYFSCKQDHGIFVPAKRVHKCSPDQVKTLDSKSLRSTITSPPPPWRTSSAASISNESPSSSSQGRLSSNSATCYSPNSCASSISVSSPILQQVRSSDYQSASPSYTDGGSFKHWPKSRPSHDDKTKVPPLAYTTLKFDESDIERELRKSLNCQPVPKLTKVVGSHIEQVKPKSVKYTFTSPKYGGNPIAWRSVEFN